MSMQCWVCMVCWEFLSYVVNFTAAECAWQNLVWIVFYVEGCGASSAEYCVHLVCREFFFLCIVGKMAQDVGMV